MPTTTPTIDWGVLSFVGIEAAQERRDGLRLESGVLAANEKFQGKNGGKRFTSGREDVSVTMFTPTGITGFTDGYDEFDNSTYETERVAMYQPAVSGLLLKIGVVEAYTYGSTMGALKDKTKTLVSAGMGFLHRNWTQRAVAGIGSGFSSWGTFNGIDFTSGVFEYLSAGSQSNTIGGLSKSTYATVPGWNNRVVNLNEAYGSNQTGLYQLVVATRRHKIGGKKYWLFSDQGLTNQKRAVQANERYYEKDLDSGMPVERYHGFPIFQEPQMPVSTATGGSGTNTRPFTALLVDGEDIFWKWMRAVKMDNGGGFPDGYFGVGEWRPISGMQSVYGMPIYVAGQLIVADMGSSGLAYDGEVY